MKGFIEIRHTDSETYYINISQIRYIYLPSYAPTDYERNLGENFTQIHLDNKIFSVKKSIEEIEELIKSALED